jgi:prepilin-type N-terminal cleavage/methylation domain-containing protein
MNRSPKQFGQRASRVQAFTLIELMVVVAIMGIVMAMGIPNIYRAWRKEAMRQAVSEVVELCSTARARSILQSSETEVVFNGGDGTILLGSGSPAPAKARSDSGPDSDFPAMTPAPVGKTTSMRLPESVAISKLLVNGLNGMDRQQIRVRFRPNGTCDDLILQMRSDKNEQVEITLELTTGLALVKYNPMEFRLK